MSHTPACWASFVSPTYEMGANANERGIRKSEGKRWSGVALVAVRIYV